MGLRAWMGAAAAALAMAAAGAASAATVLYSSIPDLTVAPSSAWNATWTQTVIAPFTLTARSDISAFVFAESDASYPGNIGLEIFADAGNGPGKSIGDFSTADISYAAGASGVRLITAKIDRYNSLAAGNYWLGFWDPDTLYVDGFGNSGSMLHCAQYFTDQCVSTGATAGLQALGTAPVPAPVPEPETWTVLLVGLGLVGASLRRQNGAVLTLST